MMATEHPYFDLESHQVVADGLEEQKVKDDG